MSNEQPKKLNIYQRLALGQSLPLRYATHTSLLLLRAQDDTLYRRCCYTSLKGTQGRLIKGYLPILKKEGEDWIGYNYSPRDMATYLLHYKDQFSWRYKSLKWVEIGRGIGARGTYQEWKCVLANADIITKMINPTLDMLLPVSTFED